MSRQINSYAFTKSFPTKSSKNQSSKINFNFHDGIEKERKADIRANLFRLPIFNKSISKSHMYSKREMEMMSYYESIDFWDSKSLIFKEHLKAKDKHLRWIKWFFYIGIGLSVGIWAFIFFQTLDLLSDLKILSLRLVFERTNSYYRRNIRETYVSTNNSIVSNMVKSNLVTPAGLEYRAAFFGCAVYIFIGVALSALSTFFCSFFPPAAGSGVPEVMAYLNGVYLPHIFNIKVFILKTFSSLTAVVAGLPLGSEGPTIHIGAIIGSCFPLGRSKNLRLKFFKFMATQAEHRDFITAGAAAGVTAAFGSPIGGLLFVMEEIASFFPVKLAWMVFCSCLICIFVIDLTRSYLDAWIPIDRSHVFFGEILDSSINMFNINVYMDKGLNIYTFLPSFICGIVMGFFAFFFSTGFIRCLKFRAFYFTPSPIKRTLEVIFFTAIYCFACFLITLPFECLEIPKGFTEIEKKIDGNLFSSLCTNPQTQYHPLGTLSMTSSYNSLRMLYSRQTSGLFPWHSLLIFFLLYFIGAFYAVGMFLATGVIIPSLLIGALFGRLIGELFGVTEWADPGTIALISSAAFFGGQSRLTFSLIVIMAELTGDFTHMLCLMLAIIISKSIADKFCPSMYHQIIHFKCIPFLDMQINIQKLDAFSVKDIMNSPACTIRTIENLDKIIDLLLNTSHNCFPVVSLFDNLTFRGTILRSDLSALLWYGYFNSKGMADYIHHPTFESLNNVKKKISWDDLDEIPPNLLSGYHHHQSSKCIIDLNPYIDSGAFCTRDTVCISRAFYLFRFMGLRHLPVTDRHNKIVGMISRKDLIMEKIHLKIQKLIETTAEEDNDDSFQIFGKKH